MTRRSLVGLLAAVAFALGVAAWQGSLHWSARNPRPDVVLGVGESVEIDGASYRLDAFDVAPRLPAVADAEEEWVEALDGAMLVRILLTTEIDGPREPRYCDPTAYDAAGRRWDNELLIDVAGTEVYSCDGPSDDPIRPGEPLTVGYVFQVPADAVDTLYVDLSLGYKAGLVRLTR